MKTIRPSIRPAVVAMLLGAAWVAGCSSTEPATTTTTATAPVIAPGRPGEPARTIASGDTLPSDVLRRQEAAGPADIAFARAMVPHHAQAVQMAALAPRRTANAQIRALADRIRAAQEPEIDLLRSWLVDQGEVPPRADTSGSGHGADHGGGAMPDARAMGMASPGELERLAASRGRTFDELFVALMARHHQGAVDMALRQTRDGSDQRMLELATNIAVEQRVEIGRMRAALDSGR
ncbi:MAG: DUF305 domain-containing protein [Angustibacter sp.]